MGTSTSRLEVFSNGVMAIIITIVVLEISLQKAIGLSIILFFSIAFRYAMRIIYSVVILPRLIREADKHSLKQN